MGEIVAQPGPCRPIGAVWERVCGWGSGSYPEVMEKHRIEITYCVP